ncbi:minichromosome maintenance protein MCM, partial [Candidatus Bathyarchaeota archaeon]|nr:minichromosome maintenance protein MCM [Candidatus Bathyarchaeota archaeon]
MTNEMLATDPQERFQDILTSDKYRQRISEMAITGKISLIVDFEDLMATDSALAENVIERPDEYLEHANRAALAQLQIEEPEYAEGIEKVSVQFMNLPVTTLLRQLGSDNIGKLVMVEGIVVRATPARPMVTRAAFKCKRCGEVSYRDQTSPFLRAPF